MSAHASATATATAVVRRGRMGRPGCWWFLLALVAAPVALVLALLVWVPRWLWRHHGPAVAVAYLVAWLAASLLWAGVR